MTAPCCPLCGVVYVTPVVGALPIEVRLLARILDAIAGCDDGTVRFFRALLDTHPKRRYTLARQLATALDVNNSTLTSRFMRHELPSPKDYVLAVMMVRAAARYNGGRASLAVVADELGASSPQSFGRSVRNLGGTTAKQFLCDLQGDGAMEWFMASYITPYITPLRVIAPLAFVPETRRKSA